MSGEAAVSVPGKTILFGEHAAVYGHHALVTALDRRMTVTVKTPSSRGPSTLHLVIPALGLDRTIPLPRILHDAGEAGDLAALAVTAAAADFPRFAAGFDARIESEIPVGSGFGSSAALAVAAVAACRDACDAPLSLDEIARLALSIENHQHRGASGVDVQAVLRGGVLWCRRLDDGTLAWEALAATKGLDAFRMFHSGTPGETTGEMVAGVRRLREREPARVGDAFAEVERAAHDGRAALGSGDRAALVGIVHRAEAALEAIDVVPAPVRTIIRAIEARGGAAKISGAGGRTGAGAGLVLVVHPDPAWHDRFVPPSGWTPHRVGLGAQGLRTEVAA